MTRPWPNSSEALDLPVEELGICVLERLAAARWKPGERPVRTGQIHEWVRRWDRADGYVRNASEVLAARDDLVSALAESWDWLRAEGLLALAATATAHLDAYIVTRRGREVLRANDPLSVVRTRRRLGLELHPELSRRLEPLTRAGAFEQAAFDALRQVEVRVRELAGDPRDQRGQRLTGVGLMQLAFGERGRLTDQDADAGEQRGTRELFCGAFGAVRNPIGHRNVEWDDPTEAAEMVLFADLLMRRLDRVADRLVESESDS